MRTVATKKLLIILGVALLILGTSIGWALAFLWYEPAKKLAAVDFAAAVWPEADVAAILAQTEGYVADMAEAEGLLLASIATAQEEDAKVNQQLAELAKAAKSNKNLSMSVYEEMIVERLGEAIYTHSGTNSEIQIFELEKEDMRGYMAKIKLKTNNALKIVLAPENATSGETTLSAIKRTEAVLGINGGGFGTSGGKQTPLGNTMIEGELINDFLASWNDLAFVGFTKNNKLVGGIYDTEKELLASGAYQGVSFVPVLIQDWEAAKVPSKWANAKQPRTVLGQYPNGDIFFIVVDGRQSTWSNGITLEEMQVLLLRLGVMEAYNLDGGGSSTFVYNNKVLNKPSDGTSRKLPTNIVIMP